MLVAYHRIDAAEAPDDEANAPTDKVLNRNPCDAIQEEDSVKPSNAVELFGMPDIDGGLIGGASLNVNDFMAVVEVTG